MGKEHPKSLDALILNKLLLKYSFYMLSEYNVPFDSIE